MLLEYIKEVLNIPRYHANSQVFSTQLCERVPHVHGPIKRPAAAKSPKRRKKKKNRSRLLHCTHELTRLLDFSDAENLRTEVFNTTYLTLLIGKATG